VLLLSVWLLRWIGSGRAGVRTPMDGSLLLLALMIPIAVWASALPELTLPADGLIFGLAAFRATANAVRLSRSLGWAVIVFLGLGLTPGGVRNGCPPTGPANFQPGTVVSAYPPASAGVARGGKGY